jgi:hypothetical protein
MKIQTMSTYVSASSICRNFFWKKIKISNFGGISKFLELFVFGQISALLGTFGQIWVDFAAFTVAESMPKLELKSKNAS